MKLKIHQVVKYNMIIAIPASIGLAVLSSNIMKMLFPSREDIDIAANLLMVGALAVALYALSTTTTAILQAIDFMKLPVINSAISLVGHIFFVVIFLKSGMGIYSLAIGNVIFALGVCILNWISISKHLDYKQEIKSTFIIPLISSLIMGVFTYGSAKGIMYICHSNLIATIISIIIAIILYAVSLVKLGGMSKEDIIRFPKGKVIYNLLVKLHIMR